MVKTNVGDGRSEWYGSELHTCERTRGPLAWRRSSSSGVTKVYGNGFVAVDDVSLTIADGEFMVLVGPSGCGKSTLLRMIAGPRGGDGRDDPDRRRATSPISRRGDRDIAMVFQSYALYPHMTVRENLGFGLKVRQDAEGARSDGASRRSRRCSASTELLDRKPAQLSGGQRQRVAMGRAIVREPRAFLMDEPLSNLDAKLRVGDARRRSRSCTRGSASTTIYVTHDQVEAMTLGQRVAVMRDGRIVQVDAPQALYDGRGTSSSPRSSARRR